MTARNLNQRARKVKWGVLLFGVCLLLVTLYLVMHTVTSQKSQAEPLLQKVEILSELRLPVSDTLSIPSVGIQGGITEYTQADAERDGGVDPQSLDSISWYSGVEGGTLSASATNTAYLYGHSWVEPAVFNGVRDMQPGATAVITTEGGETLTYVMAEPVFTVTKSDLPSDIRVTEAKPGRLVLVSCYRPDSYDPELATVENVVAVLQLVR